MATEEKDKLREGIAYFEQILQMMPEDRATLEFLCIAYEQTGDTEKYQRVLVSLARVMVKEHDFEGAQKLLENLEKHDEPEIKAVELKIRAMLVPAMGVDALRKVPAAGQAPTEGRTDERGAAVRAELALVDWLETNQIVEHELAEKVRGQLRSYAGVAGEFLISALSVLESESSAVAESAASCVADETKVPPLALEMFDQTAVLVKELPEGLVRVRGAVPFGRVADEMLVAVANPMDRELMRRIAQRFGGKCHFFFAPPVSLGVVMERLFPDMEK